MPDLSLAHLETPALLLDEQRMQRNIARMRAQLQHLRVGFRPHVKTSKSLEVTQRLLPEGPGPITVSTLHEADFFAARGFTDILYAVSIAPNKLAHAAALQDRGVRLSLILDNLQTARALAAERERSGRAWPVLIEIDCDGHRSGIVPDAPQLLELGRFLDGAGIPVHGVLTHAGSSYDCTSTDAIRAMARQERDAVVHAAGRLRAAGSACPVVSVGSTPTATFADDLAGVTEVRAGVFVFFDLVMAGIGVCRVDDIALSVLGTVIGTAPTRAGPWSTPAGWRCRATAAPPARRWTRGTAWSATWKATRSKT